MTSPGIVTLLLTGGRVDATLVDIVADAVRTVFEARITETLERTRTVDAATVAPADAATWRSALAFVHVDAVVVAYNLVACNF